MKKILFIILLVVVFIFALDFIPIKLAVIHNESSLNANSYICEIDMKTPVYPTQMWIADKKLNLSITYDYGLFLLPSKDPHEILSKHFFNKHKMFEEKQNKFYFEGNVKDILEEGSILWGKFDVNEWSIVYPIKRLGIRSLYAPKRYLTIYDYDWIAFLRQL